MRKRIGIAVAVVIAVVGCVGGSVAVAEAQEAKKKLTLKRLYSYPRLEGTAPVQPEWSADSRKVAFLWNDEGMPFRDLWLYNAETGERTRLTRLPHDPDEWTTPASLRDKRLKKYLPPPAGLRNFEWAPDSQRLTFPFRGELYIVSVGGSEPARRLTKTKGGEANPKFSPDSGRLAFVSGGELHVRGLRTGETVQLTSNGGLDIEDEGERRPGTAPGTYKWSPDGEWIAFQWNNNGGVKGRLIANYSGERVTTRKQNWRIAREGNGKTRLGVVPAGGGNTVWLTEVSEDYYYDWEWSKDSNRIAVTRVEENQKNRFIEVIDVRAAIESAKARKEGTAEDSPRLRSGQAEGPEKGAEKKKKKPEWIRTLYREIDDRWICSLCNFVVWSPDDKQLLFSSEGDGWNHLYLIASDGSEEHPRQITRGEWEVNAYRLSADLTPQFDASGAFVYFTASKEDSSRRDLYAVYIGAQGESGEDRIVRLTERKGVNAGVVSKDGSRIALLFSSFAEPWDLYVGGNKEIRMTAAAASGESNWKRMTESPLPEFSEYEWPQPRIVEYPARDGKTVRALLFYPPGIPVNVRRNLSPAQRARSGRRRDIPKVPVINFVHGAGYAQAVLNRWGGYHVQRFQFNQFASQQGYLVIDADYRGSSGYGRDWRTDVYLHLGGLDMQDELAAMDYLKTLGWADTERAGVWGVSYGGFMTLMLSFNAPDAFRAGSAWASVTDWENYNRGYTQQRLRTPKEQPEAYKRSSPIHHVEGLKNNLQLVHGVGDSNVHFQDIMQLTDALVAAGKPFTQQFYPQSNHGWVRPEVWIHSTRSMFEFFERHLKVAK